MFSSVRFGIVLMALLFIYMSVGSAGIVYPTHPNIFHSAAWTHEQMRQWPMFEMTEFEWFHWWPFDLLIALISATMIVTTIRRIPFRPVNYGVWMIHAGIIILIVGSVIYFELKVEGDAPVARRKLVLRLDGVADPVELLAAQGAAASIGTGDGRIDIEVIETDPAWMLRSGSESGKAAYSVTLRATSASRSFMRQVIAGHPEFTEDLIVTDDPKQPMKRAVKESGNAIIEPRLSVQLDYESQGYFYLRNDLAKSWALYLRRPASASWAMRPIDGLPLYNDRISSAESVFESGDGALVPVNPMRVEVAAIEAGDPCPDILFSIDGYLRYAQTRTRLVAGGPGAPRNPTAQVVIASAEGARAPYRLVALDPSRASADGGLIKMVAIEREEEMGDLAAAPTIRIAIPSANVEIVGPIESKGTEGAPEFVPISDPELGYAYRVIAAQDELPVAGKQANLLIVDIKTPTKTIRRWVFDDATMTRDVPEEAGGHAAPSPPDESIVMEYRPGMGRSLVLLVAGPQDNQLRVVSAIGKGDPQVLPVKVGGTVALEAGLTATVESFEPRALALTRPVSVPLGERMRDAREMFAQAHVSSPGGGATWVEYSPYAFDDYRFALSRHPFHPTRVRLGDGSEVEVLFSRQRLPLGTEAALEDFLLSTHGGGYTGETGSIRNYTSLIRFRDEGTSSWGPTTQVSVNEPVEHRGLWYFQAQWDPPEPPSARNPRGSAGLNYTVLGVGNREGVWVQLAGCIVAVVGMIYAFYVKPVLIRKRTREAAARAKGAVSAASVALAMIVALACTDRAGAQESFSQLVDLSPLDSVAVQTEGRIKSFGSFAHSEMGHVSGPRRIAGQRPEFTYLDLILRPEAYEDADIIYVKGAPVRAPIAEALVAADPELSGRMDGFMKSGLISEELLARPELEDLIARLEGDLLKTAKSMDAVRSARAMRRPEVLLSRLRVVPAAPGDPSGRWHSLDEVMLLAADPAALRAAGESARPVPGLDEAKQRACATSWRALVEAWHRGDVGAVNLAVAEFAGAIKGVNASGYPDASRLKWESWYFANGNLVWIWPIFGFSVALLLLGVTYHWRWAKRAGFALYLVGFLLQTGALLLRWWISDRWPNSNMFEAVTTAAWFGGCAAVILEIALRKRAASGMFALASAVSSAVALMAAHFLPVELNAQIGNMMPVLHDVWLYIHTNVIIFSYCLIFMAAISALAYLVYRFFGGEAVYARVGAVAGGEQEGTKAARAGEVLDGVTMLLMKLSFVLLWAGIVMGAIWADHSWGRPWGWDPKEVFALNTFVVFALLVHVRYRVKDKGLWTAILAVVGAAVMLFNWIVINFIITGLHSYA